MGIAIQGYVTVEVTRVVEPPEPTEVLAADPPQPEVEETTEEVVNAEEFRVVDGGETIRDDEGNAVTESLLKAFREGYAVLLHIHFVGHDQRRLTAEIVDLGVGVTARVIENDIEAEHIQPLHDEDEES